MEGVKWKTLVGKVSQHALAKSLLTHIPAVDVSCRNYGQIAPSQFTEQTVASTGLNGVINFPRSKALGMVDSGTSRNRTGERDGRGDEAAQQHRDNCRRASRTMRRKRMMRRGLEQRCRVPGREGPNNLTWQVSSGAACATTFFCPIGNCRREEHNFHRLEWPVCAGK